MDTLTDYRSRNPGRSRPGVLVTLASDGVEVVSAVNADGDPCAVINGGFLDGESFVGDNLAELHAAAVMFVKGGDV